MLSCVEANIEVLLRHAGAADVLTALGALCSLDVLPPAQPVLTPLPRDAWIERSTGLRLTSTPADTAAKAIDAARAAAESGSPTLVVADAFTVPWNPYAGHEHHEHGFVVDGAEGDRLHIVDAYVNTTRYGPTEPGARWIEAAELISVLRPAGDRFELRNLVGAGPATDRDTVAAQAVAANVAAWREAAAEGRDATALARFADGGLDAEGLAWLSLAVWLISRSRQVHARWWQERTGESVDAEASVGAAAPKAAEAVVAAAEPVLRQWQTTQTMTYLAWRRVEAGHPCPTTLAATLSAAAEAETAWFEAMAAGS
ncbi:hypothetical protein ACFQ9X_32975 [Catenulispora yoronensis]